MPDGVGRWPLLAQSVAWGYANLVTHVWNEAATQKQQAPRKQNSHEVEAPEYSPPMAVWVEHLTRARCRHWKQHASECKVGAPTSCAGDPAFARGLNHGAR